MQVIFKIIGGKQAGQELSFDENGVCLIGRGADCTWVIPPGIDGKISRHHCLVIIRMPYLFVRDLGSRNGTFLNNELLPAGELGEDPDALQICDRPFRNGDKLQIGETIIQLVVGAVEETTVENYNVLKPDNNLNVSKLSQPVANIFAETTGTYDRLVDENGPEKENVKKSVDEEDKNLSETRREPMPIFTTHQIPLPEKLTNDDDLANLETIPEYIRTPSTLKQSVADGEINGSDGVKKRDIKIAKPVTMNGFSDIPNISSAFPSLNNSKQSNVVPAKLIQPGAKSSSQPMPAKLIQPGAKSSLQPMPAKLIQPEAKSSSQPMPAKLIQPGAKSSLQPMPAKLIQPGAKSSSQPMPAKLIQPEAKSSLQPMPAKLIQPEAKSSSQPMPAKLIQPGAKSSSQPMSAKLIQPGEKSNSQPMPAKLIQPGEKSNSQPMPAKLIQPGEKSISQLIPAKLIRQGDISKSQPLPALLVNSNDMNKSRPIPAKLIQPGEKSSSQLIPAKLVTTIQDSGQLNKLHDSGRSCPPKKIRFKPKSQ